MGVPFGSVFELGHRTLKMVKEYDITEAVPEVATGGMYLSFIECSKNVADIACKDATDAGDNSKFMDSNTAQKLKMEDIQELREQGASGSDIIRSLIQNSETWDSKSQFAKQKWLARKQKR